MSIPSHRFLRIVTVSLATLTMISLGCVTAELRSVNEAKEDYDACVAKYSSRDAECEATQNRVIDAQDYYEQQARRGWSCDPRAEECPVQR